MRWCHDDHLRAARTNPSSSCPVPSTRRATRSPPSTPTTSTARRRATDGPCASWPTTSPPRPSTSCSRRAARRSTGAPAPGSSRRKLASHFRVHADDLLHHWHDQPDDQVAQADWQSAELGAHTWDLVRALGRPMPLDDEVAERGLAFMQQGLTDDNRGEAFGAAGRRPRRRPGLRPAGGVRRPRPARLTRRTDRTTARGRRHARPVRHVRWVRTTARSGDARTQVRPPAVATLRPGRGPTSVRASTTGGARATAAP